MRAGHEVQYNDDNTVTVTGRCFVTKQIHSVTVPREGFDRWQQGEYIQNALRSVSKDDREFLISGTSPAGWRQIFGDDGEPD